MNFASKRFNVRLLAAGDAGLYASLYGDPETMTFVAPARALDQLERSFAACCRANEHTPPRRRTWVIHERASATDVGLIGLVWDSAPVDGRQGAELGVMLPTARQGRGVATEVIDALLAPAFARLDLDFLHTSHRDGHGLAAGLMRRVGFVAQPNGEDGSCRWRYDRHPQAESSAR